MKYSFELILELAMKLLTRLFITSIHCGIAAFDLTIFIKSSTILTLVLSSLLCSKFSMVRIFFKNLYLFDTQYIFGVGVNKDLSKESILDNMLEI